MGEFEHSVSPCPGLTKRGTSDQAAGQAADLMANFPQGCHLNITVVFPGEYRIGYKYLGLVYVPGLGSYYPLEEALGKCWAAFQANRAKGVHS